MIKENVLFMMILLSLVYGAKSLAHDKTYFADHARGWHWYETHPLDEKEEEEEGDPITHMDAIKWSVKRALDQAILHPSKENVGQYIALQNQLAARSAHFARLWQAALLADPSLDFSLRHPTNNVARQVEVDEESIAEEKAIKKLAKESGLFFFYKSTCAYCRAFAPILKRFTDQYQIPLLPITMDGVSLPEFPFPLSVPDHGQAARFHVTVEPSLFIVNPYSQKAIPVGFGLLSETDLKKRILDIARGQA